MNFDNVILWRQYEVIYAKIGSENIIFGQYEFPERAAEVFLDMSNSIITTYDNYVYYMPEK